MISWPEKGFIYLQRDRAKLMLKQAGGPRRRTAPLERPFGRGVNLQIDVGSDVDASLERAMSGQVEIVVALEDVWYRTSEGLVGQSGTAN